MRRNRSSGRASRSGQSGFTASLERMTERLDRITTTLEAIASRIGSELAPSPREAAGHGSSGPANSLVAGAGSRNRLSRADLTADGTMAGEELNGIPPTEAMSLLDQLDAPSSSILGASSDTSDQFAPMLPEVFSLPSAGLSPLQDYSRDSASQSHQLEQIQIAREQLSEQKKTNQYLEKQQGNPSAAVFGP